MKAIVLDCSVAMSWCFEDESSAFTDRVLESLSSTTAIVPGLWSLEVGNVLIMSERRGRLSEAQARQFMGLLESLPIEVDEQTAREALGNTWSMAREHGLTSYDASYLELAVRRRLPLATQDKVLRQAAKRCGVSLVL